MPAPDAKLDAVLHAAFMIEYCLYWDDKKRGSGDVGPMVGILDWVCELRELLEGVVMNANAKQVGGAHYAGIYQHWDWVVENHLGYLEGQISKYVCRWRRKNGLEDLEKAKHFLDKLIEVCATKNYLSSKRPQTFAVGMDQLRATFPDTSEKEMRICQLLVVYHREQDLQLVKLHLGELIHQESVR